MSNPAHDLLLLLLNLTQQKSADRVRATFTDAVSALFAPHGLRWLEPEEEFAGETIAVATFRKEFGRFAVLPSGEAGEEILPLLRTAASMLAAILEKSEADRLLADEKLLLQEQVNAHTAELSRANRNLKLEIEERMQMEKALLENERTLLQAQRITHIGSWVWHLAANEATCSEEMLRIWGFDLEKKTLPLEAFVRRIHPEDRRGVVEAMDSAVKGAARYDEIFRIILPDATERVINGSGEVVFGEDGRSVAMHGTSQDITERSLAERALRESEEKFKHAVDNLPIGISMTRPSGEVKANKAMYDMLGYTEGLPDLKWQDITHPDDMAFSQQFVDSVLSGEKDSGSFVKRYLHRDGSVVWTELNATLRRDEQGRPQYFLTTINDITERRRADESLRESERTLQQAQRLTHIGSWIWDGNTDMVVCSDEMLRIWGYGPDRKTLSLQEVLCRIHPGDVARVEAALAAAMSDSGWYEEEFRIIHPDAGERYILGVSEVVVGESGQVTGVRGTGQDITDRRRAEEEKASLEEQLHQSQKMEAVGRLAGGVAHDFNNILTGIIGFAELIQATLGPGDPVHGDLEEIRKAANRAADLTGQLLAFSRKQIIHPMVIQPNEVLQNSQKMLCRIIGEDIDFVFNPSRDLWRIRADTGQLDQILVNLAVNARDAMPGGGRLTIETRNVTIEEAYSRAREGLESGEYVMLAVSDNGEGMDRETRAHIFEPFYSTKSKDQGTGLGLSTVYGIMKQNKGFIDVYSEPGVGTTFKIYFPAVMEEADPLVPPDMVSPAKGSETILLVEDEEMVRRLAKKILEKHGYSVIDKHNGGLAMMWAEKSEEPIDLLLTDVIMPGMNGRELLERLQGKRPGLKALFMSGYTENVIAHHGVLDQGTEFIQKPFSVGSLTRKVRDVLDS